MTSTFVSARAEHGVAEQAARRGWALARASLLVLASGVLLALVLATIFVGMVVAIDGKLP